MLTLPFLLLMGIMETGGKLLFIIIIIVTKLYWSLWISQLSYPNNRYPFDGPGGTLAHAFYPQNSDSISGDVHFDNEEPWYSHSDSSTPEERRALGISFLDVAVHELGHSLGWGHSPIVTSVMFPYYKSSKSGEPQWDYDDITAMYYLYSKNYH